MDWENHPIEFFCGIAAAAAFGALSSIYKTINGEGFRWRKMSFRWLYRVTNGLIGGLLISTFTADLRILWASILAISVSGVGEDTLIKWLPFNIDDPKQTKTSDRICD